LQKFTKFVKNQFTKHEQNKKKSVFCFQFLVKKALKFEKNSIRFGSRDGNVRFFSFCLVDLLILP